MQARLRLLQQQRLDGATQQDDGIGRRAVCRLLWRIIGLETTSNQAAATGSEQTPISPKPTPATNTPRARVRARLRPGR